MRSEDRKKTLQDLKSGAIRVIVNAMVLTEGFDDPTLGAVLIARPTRSKALYIQMVGRVLRQHPTKEYALIIDTTGSSIHGTQIAARLTEKPTAKEIREETEGLPVLEEFGKPPEDADPQNSKEQEIVSRFLEEASSGFSWSFSSARVNWIEAAPGLFALPLGEDNKAIVLFQRGDRWVAEAGSMKILEASDMSLVQGAAEDYARSQGALGLSWKTAAWRSRDPSEKQMRLLRRYRIFYVDGALTAGEASDLITAAIVRKRYKHKVQEILL
jgi:ATP-dependent helicase IRC3